MKTKFSEKFKKLEEIVSKLENEELDLDEAIFLYDEGVKLSQTLEKELDKVSEKMVDNYGE